MTICFHWFAGRPREAFYTDSTDFNLVEALKDGTPDNQEFIREMDEVAEELKKLRDAGVPVLWRPFHECDGGWFWWGAKGAAVFRQAWVFMFERFVQTHGLTNLVWCYNPTARSGALEEWYPGDEYVDIISLDTYPPTGTHEPFAVEYRRFHDFRNGRKIVGMSENGAIPDPDRMFESDAHWAWFCTWNGFFTTDGIVNPVDFLSRVYQHPRVLTLDELDSVRPRLDLPPAIRLAPVAASASPGDTVSFGVIPTGSRPLVFQWLRDGVELAGETRPFLTLDGIESGDASSFSVRVGNANGIVVSEPAVLTLVSDPSPTPRLVNLSTRGFVGRRGDAMIAGLVVGGTGAKQLLIRAVGPTLGEERFGVSGVLADPTLSLTLLDGTVLASNDDWSADPDEAMRLETAFVEAGAFLLSRGSRDASLTASLPPGAYTVIVRGVAETTGKALVEVYDLERNTGARLVNLSTRARTGPAEEAIIAGFVIEGGSSSDILLRAVGPTLAQSPFSLPGALADPVLTLRRWDGTIVVSNAGWAHDPAEADLVRMAGASVSAFPLLPGSGDAAFVRSEASDAMTAVVRSDGGSAGTALVEIYEIR